MPSDEVYERRLRRKMDEYTALKALYRIKTGKSLKEPTLAEVLAEEMKRRAKG